MISKVIDESEKSVKVENRQTEKRIVERQKNYYMNDRWGPAEVIEDSSKF